MRFDNPELDIGCFDVVFEFEWCVGRISTGKDATGCHYAKECDGVVDLMYSVHV